MVLKSLFKAAAVGLVIGGAIYLGNPPQVMQREYPSINTQDAEKLQIDHALRAGIGSFFMAAIFVLPGSRKHPKSEKGPSVF